MTTMDRIIYPLIIILTAPVLHYMGLNWRRSAALSFLVVLVVLVLREKTLWAGIQCGRHHGKGNKLKNQGNNERAIIHFKEALLYAEKTGNKGTVAFENECIAISLLELKNPVEAKKYAERSLELYRILAGQNEDEFFAVAVSRVEKLVSEMHT